MLCDVWFLILYYSIDGIILIWLRSVAFEFPNLALVDFFFSFNDESFNQFSLLETVNYD